MKCSGSCACYDRYIPSLRLPTPPMPELRLVLTFSTDSLWISPYPPLSSANWISLLCQPLLLSFTLGLLNYTYTNRGCEHPPLGSVHTSVCLIPPSRCSRALSLVHRFRRSLFSTYLWLLSSLSVIVCINSNPRCRAHFVVHPRASSIPALLTSVSSNHGLVYIETTMSAQVGEMAVLMVQYLLLLVIQLRNPTPFLELHTEVHVLCSVDTPCR